MGPGRAASIDLFLSYSSLIEPEAETRPLPPALLPFHTVSGSPLAGPLLTPCVQVYASSFSGKAASMQGHAAPEANDFLLRSQSSRRAAAVPSSSPAHQAPREDRARPAGALLVLGGEGKGRWVFTSSLQVERAASSGRVPPPDRYDGRNYPSYAPQTYARPLYAPPPPGIFIRVNEPQPPLRHQVRRGEASPRLPSPSSCQYLPSSGQTLQTHRPVNMSAGPTYPRTAKVSVASPSFSTVAEPSELLLLDLPSVSS